tara:strand:- start:312 stop:3371 length:3060 start_codon:yes stop_codon:yes gene_type:complete
MAITKIGTPELFDFSATNTALQLPTGTSLERPTSAIAGQWRYNTDEKYVEYYDGTTPYDATKWFQIDTEAPTNPNDFPSENFNVNTYFGNGGTQTLDAKFNEAANFNGSSSYIEISQTLLGSGTLKTWSTSFWFKTSSSTEQYLNNTAAASNNSGYGVYIKSSGYLIFTTSSGGGGISEKGLEYQTDLSDGAWHNVVATYTSAGGTNDATLKLYVDGADVTSSSVAVNGYVAGSGSTYNSFTIPRIVLGRWADTGSAVAVMKGAMDQVRFFNTTLTDAQAIDCYTDETTTTAATLNFPVGAGCIAAYQLDGDASDVGGTYGGAETNIGYTGLKFTPDLTWIKIRTTYNYDHNLYDTVRGADGQSGTRDKVLMTNSNSQQEQGNGDVTILTNSVKLVETNVGASGQEVNKDGEEFVSWNFKAGGAPTQDNSGGSSPTPGSIMVDGSAYTTTLTGTIVPKRATANTAAGFSIINYDGSGISNGTLNHFLSAAPELYIWKRISSSSDWSVAGKDINNYQGYLELNDDVIINVDSTMQAPTSSLIKFNTTSASYNGSGQEWMLYVFHSVDGYQKIGSYTGTGNASGNYVFTDSNGDGTGTGAFEPAFLLVKRTDVAADWFIYDNKRVYGSEAPANPLDGELRANRDLAEDDYDGYNFYTNGFEVANNGTNMNAAGGNYIFLAIAADKDSSVPTVTNSFSPTLYTGDGASSRTIITGIDNDFVWIKKRGPSTGNNLLQNTVQGGGTNSAMSSNSTTAAGNFDQYGYISAFTTNGVRIQGGTSGSYPNDNANENNSTYVAWAWKVGGLPTLNSDGNITSIVSANQAAGMSIVEYKTAGSKTIGHGLLQAPELIIQKRIDVTSLWVVYTATTGLQNYLQLQDTAAVAPDANFMTAVGTSTFTSQWSSNTHNYINYCFHSVAGYVDVGSYAGVSTGTRTHVTGFEPSFVMIKGTNFSDSWYVYDNKRRTPPSSILFADLADAEYTIDNSALYVTFVSGGAGVGGFTTSGVVSGIDGATRNFIYLAIK